MDFAKVEDYSLFPWPERVWFVAVFLLVALVVARFRPRWLFALWIDAWLLAVAGTLLRLGTYALSVPIAAEVVLMSGVPIGSTTLWLHLTRRRRLLGHVVVQGVGAVVAYAGGLAAAVVVLTAVFALAGYR